MGIWTEIWETIRRHKLRTAITGFSVGWGIFLIVVLRSVGNGLGNDVKDQFKDDVVNSVWISPRSTSIPFHGLPIDRKIRCDNEDYAFLKENLK